MTQTNRAHTSNLNLIFLQGEKYASLMVVAAVEMELIVRFYILMAFFGQLYIPKRYRMYEFAYSLSFSS